MSELDSLWLKIVLAIVPVPAVYLLYFRSFLKKLEYVEHAEAFLWGLALAGSLLFLSLWDGAIGFRHYVLQGFFRAALIEKAGAFLLILFLIKRRGVHVVVWECVISAMLLGLGFSAAENIVYAFGSGTAVIAARFFSAVPLHVATCGMIGYFIAKAVSSWSLWHRVTLFTAAALIPWALHGAFDAALLSGSTPAFFIGPILVGTVLGLEYMLARAQTLPALEILNELGFHAEDWETILRESQYERWILRSMGAANTEYVPFIQWHLTRARIVIVTVLGLIGITAPFVKGPALQLLGLALGPFESITLFTVLPITYAFALISVGAVNPAYFRNSMIKIPIIADVTYRWPGNQGTAITYDINSANAFIQSVESLPRDMPIEVVFEFPGFTSPSLFGEVIWNNHVDPAQPSGTVVRFDKKPPGFYKFLFRYTLFKFVRGLTFNLHLPGFEIVRRFFVRPESVMQTEKRFTEGSILFLEGDEGRDFYLIRKGEVEILKNVGGSETRMTVLGPGELFGELAVVGDRVRAATARCLSDCVLAVADGANLEALIAGNPDFTRRLIEVLSSRIVTSEGIMTKNVRDLTQAAKSREEIMFAAIHMLLVGAGFPAEMNAIVVGVDFEKIARQFMISVETARGLFGFLMRYESTMNLPPLALERFINTQVHEAYSRYKVVVEESS